MRIDPGTVGALALASTANQLAKVQWSQGVAPDAAGKTQIAAVLESSAKGVLVQLGGATGWLVGMTGLNRGDAVPLQFQMGPEGPGWYASAKAASATASGTDTAELPTITSQAQSATSGVAPELQLLSQLLSQFANSGNSNPQQGGREIANLATLILGANGNAALANQALGADATQGANSLDAKQLQVLTERGGLFFESRVGEFAQAELDGSPVREQEWRGLVSNDLKGRLLAENRATTQAGVSPPVPESASSSLGQSVLSNIEARQIRMGIDHANTGNLYLHIPLPLESETNASWLKMEIDNRDADANGREIEKVTRFRFAVNLENLGTMRVSGFLEGDEVMLRVLTEKPEHSAAIEGALAEQFSSPIAQGEKKVEFSVGPWTAGSPAEQERFHHLEGFLPEVKAGSMVDGQG